VEFLKVEEAIKAISINIGYISEGCKISKLTFSNQNCFVLIPKTTAEKLSGTNKIKFANLWRSLEGIGILNVGDLRS